MNPRHALYRRLAEAHEADAPRLERLAGTYAGTADLALADGDTQAADLLTRRAERCEKQAAAAQIKASRLRELLGGNW